MPRPPLTALVAAAVVCCASAVLTITRDRDATVGLSASPTVTPIRTASPVATPAPPRLRRAEIDRQDRITAAQRRRESRALDDRPLLAELPLELGPVTIALAGQAPDGRRAQLQLTGSDERSARRVYRQVLKTLGDSGDAYAARWTP